MNLPNNSSRLGRCQPRRPAAAYGVGGMLALDGANRYSGGTTIAGEELDFRRGVQSLAQAGNVGELFRYTIATPVTLPRQQSAMLPIVNEDVKGEKVSIYNEGVQAKHPLNGLWLTNTTKLHLMQGPITVFDDNVYAGDAKIEDLAPGSQRLLSYALDLDTEVAPESKDAPSDCSACGSTRGR